MKYFITFLLVIFSVAAAAEDRRKIILLNTAEEIRTICDSALRQQNIFCVFTEHEKEGITWASWDWPEWVRNPDKAAYSRSFSVPEKELGFFQSASTPRFAFISINVLHLDEQNTDIFSATTRMLRPVEDCTNYYSQTRDNYTHCKIVSMVDENGLSEYLWGVLARFIPLVDYGTSECNEFINRKITFDADQREKARLLALEQYRSLFKDAKTSTELSLAISKYDGNDPDNLLPDARARLVVAIVREREAAAQAEREKEAEAARAAKAKEEAEHQEELARLERVIAFCKTQTSAANETIRRENEIAKVSGYVNKRALYEAGDMIVTCQGEIPKRYTEYKRKGGKKPLSAIR